LTLNMALGNVSVTTAITSIASSFDKLYPLPLARSGAASLLDRICYSVRILTPVAVTATVCSK
jgi:hypothetical protein